MRTICLLVFVATPLAAQGSPPLPTPIRDLPGAGRPVAIDAHAQRRAVLLDRIGVGVIAVPAAGRHTPRSDVAQDNDFRQDDYFFYLTGLETPEAWLLLAAYPNGGRDVTLYLPARDPAREQWTGIGLGPGDTAIRLTGIGRVLELEPASFEADVRRSLARAGGPLYSVIPRRSPSHPTLESWQKSGLELRGIVTAIDSMRVVKDGAELEALRRAIAITAEAHKAAMRSAEPDMYEYQIEATIEYTFRYLGADRVGFPSIVGSGPNSTILHYDVNRRKMADGDLVVMDIGAEYGQYTADITRTIPVSGRFTERQKALYDLVLGTQAAAIEAVRPGVTLRDLDAVARSYMQEHSGDLCGAQSCVQYFNHGLGHWLGMQVHDVGGNGVLEPGMVFTVEPGIYLADEGLGIRIEDDVLVTSDGCEVLSAAAPKSTEDIERLMAEAAHDRQARR